MKENIAKSIKKTMLEVSFKVRGAHMGSNLSCIDILGALYFDVMNIGEENFEKRDIFILSKAHSALALYCTLYHRGLISKKELDGYYVNDGILPVHLDRFSCKYVEFSGGSLGHGLPIALGYAFSLKQQYFKNKKEKIRNVYCLMGDGEIQEGSVWEAAMLASKLELGNLVALVDYNNLQGYGRAKELVSMDPLDKKWESFGWDCVIVDGHNCTEITNAIKKHKSENKPLCIVCKTVKGKGVSFMEDRLEWHYYAISEDELKQALEELK